MDKILIAGCGAIGLDLACALADTGHQVTGLKRNPPTLGRKNLDFVKADISRSGDLDELEHDFDHVFFILSPDNRDESSYRRVYESGLDNLSEKLGNAGCKAPWIFVSSTSVYGQCQGEWVDENSATEPASMQSRILLSAEQKLLALSSDNVIVRFSGIYGPGRLFLINKAKTKPVIQVNPPYYTNRIHQRDCVAILKFLLEKRLSGTRLEQCYLASDDAPATLWEVMTWLAQTVGLPPPVADSDKHSDMNKRCRNERIKQLGYVFEYPDFRSGYTELVSDLPD
jgi:nucleoside-diphosphate-sugar epimerase